MTLSKATYCQICERFFTKEQWNKHLFSSRHLQREVSAFWPAYFLQRKMTRDESSRLENASCEMIFGGVHVLAVYEFLKTYFEVVLISNDYVKNDDDDEDDDEDDVMGIIIVIICQLNLNKIYINQSFSHQDQNKLDDGVQR